MQTNDLNFTVIKRLIQQRKIAVANLLNVARTLFKKGFTVKYNIVNDENIIRAQIGVVQDVQSEGMEVYLVVVPDKSKKTRRIAVEYIIGVMQES
jgi:hypothetical protein